MNRYAGFKVLIVDDNPNNLFTLRTLIEKHMDVAVLEASSGQAALDKLADNINQAFGGAVAIETSGNQWGWYLDKGNPSYSWYVHGANDQQVQAIVDLASFAANQTEGLAFRGNPNGVAPAIHIEGLPDPKEADAFYQYLRDNIDGGKDLITGMSENQDGSHVIVDAWEKAYGKARVRSWIARFESTGGRSISRFESESPV